MNPNETYFIHDFKERVESSARRNTMELVSDESFVRMEEMCEKTLPDIENAEKDLLKGVKIPDLNDTLEEVDFILNLGLKLKAEGKINIPTPKCVAKSFLSDRMSFDAASTPKTHLNPSRLDPVIKKRMSRVTNSSEFGSPYMTCRSNIDSQNFLSPSVFKAEYDF